MKTIVLDIDSKEELLLDVQKNAVSFASSDTDQRFCLSLYQNGKEWSVPEEADLSVWYSGPSGEGNYTEVNGESAFSVAANTVTITPAPEMVAASGSGMMCLMVHLPNGNQRKMWNLVYTVEGIPGTGSGQVASYFAAFAGLIRQAQQFVETHTPDSTLTQAGKSADAAATGTALAGKAPAGYGLGGQSQTIDDSASLQAYSSTGFYSWGSENTDSTKPFDAGSMIVVNRNPQYFIQIAFRDSADISLVSVRKITEGNAGPWEWVNPPMEAGREYRTAERFEGLPVYCVCLVGTALEGANHAGLPVGIESNKLISVTGQVGDYPLGTAGSGDYTSDGIRLFFNNWVHSSVGFYCGPGLAGAQYRFIVKYTK